MAADCIVTFMYRGGGRDTVPRDATHVIMHESVRAIFAEAFCEHPNIVEVYCHAGVKIVERAAFQNCPRLKRVIMTGVEAVELGAFSECEVIEYLECPKLERIGGFAFENCFSLSSIDLPSAKVVEVRAFSDCDAMKKATFGENLESIRKRALGDCSSLELITIPLKNGLFEEDEEGEEEDSDEIFHGCNHLTRVDLLETEELDETIAALHLEEWRNDMTAEVGSINQILSVTDAGFYDEDEGEEIIGEKTTAIRNWIHRTLSKITRYRAQHVQLVEEAAEILQQFAPSDIVVENVIPFLELPTHTFDGENID